MPIQFSARTDIGLTRDQNEDNFLVDRKLKLFIVCDGMGGHNSGEVASATAVNVVREVLIKHKQVLADYESGTTTTTERDVRSLLTMAVQTANSRIHERGTASAAQRGMGTTLCLLLVLGSRGFYAHVGDSRLYRRRGTQVDQLTMDHSFYNEVMLNQPELANELIDDRFKNAITRALGPTASVEVDTEDFRLKPGDRFVLCSDGLHGYLDEDPGAIDRLFAMDNLDSAAEAMITYANDQGGKDNTTAVLIEVGEEVDEAAGHPKVFSVLRGFPLLRHLKDPELQAFVGMCEERRYEPGHALWKEGDETDGLYVILEGQLVITRGDVLISLIGPGQYVGSITVMDGGRRSAGASAEKGGPVTALVMSREKFNEVLLKEQALGVKLLWGIARSLAARLRNATARVASAAPADDLIRGDVEFQRGPQPKWQPRSIPPAVPTAAPSQSQAPPASAPKATTAAAPKATTATAPKTPNLRSETPAFVSPSPGVPGDNLTDKVGGPEATASTSPSSPTVQESLGDNALPDEALAVGLEATRETKAISDDAEQEAAIPEDAPTASDEPTAQAAIDVGESSPPEPASAAEPAPDSPSEGDDARAAQAAPSPEPAPGDAAAEPTIVASVEPDAEPSPTAEGNDENEVVTQEQVARKRPTPEEPPTQEPSAEDAETSTDFVPTIGDIFGASSSSGRTGRRRGGRRGLRPRRGSAKGKSD